MRVIYANAHNTQAFPRRTQKSTVEVVVNFDRIMNVHESKLKDYPGSVIVLDTGAAIYVQDDEQVIQSQFNDPTHIELNIIKFLTIEHWENASTDRAWISGYDGKSYEYKKIENANWWKRPAQTF